MRLMILIAICQFSFLASCFSKGEFQVSSADIESAIPNASGILLVVSGNCKILLKKKQVSAATDGEAQIIELPLDHCPIMVFRRGETHGTDALWQKFCEKLIKQSTSHTQVWIDCVDVSVILSSGAATYVSAKSSAINFGVKAVAAP